MASQPATDWPSEKQVEPSTTDPIENAVNDLNRRVGARVLSLRKTRGFSRRVLSELSGVSPRYLAQLESGEGNASVGLLNRVAIALEQPVEALLSPDYSAALETANLVALYRGADAATRAKVLQILDPQKVKQRKAERICLIGLRGAGKSTLGPLIGERLGAPFVELNHEIERQAAMPIAEIIALYGEDGYRKLEADTLNQVISEHSRVVLAVAGGVVDVAECFAQVIARFHTIWLTASPVEHMERVRAQGDLRPMAGNPQAMEQLHNLLRSREVFYRQAEHHHSTSGKTINVSLSELCELIASHPIFDDVASLAQPCL